MYNLITSFFTSASQANPKYSTTKNASKATRNLLTLNLNIIWSSWRLNPNPVRFGLVKSDPTHNLANSIWIWVINLSCHSVEVMKQRNTGSKIDNGVNFWRQDVCLSPLCLNVCLCDLPATTLWKVENQRLVRRGGTNSSSVEKSEGSYELPSMSAPKPHLFLNNPTSYWRRPQTTVIQKTSSSAAKKDSELMFDYL